MMKSWMSLSGSLMADRTYPSGTKDRCYHISFFPHLIIIPGVYGGFLCRDDSKFALIGSKNYCIYLLRVR